MVTEIRNTISKDPALATIAPQIQINATSGTVTLSGSVKSEQDKERIAELVRQTTGVVTVNNQLTVSSQSQTSTTTPDATSRTDSTIVGGTAQSKTDTQEGLTQNKQYDTEKQALSPTSQSASERLYHSTTNVSPTSERPETRIYSSTQPSSTTQQGQTSTEQGTTGVQGKFDLNVQATTEADRTLGQKIMQELRSNTSLAASIPMLRISLNNGKVVLKGNVKSETEKQQIESAVQRVTGVTTVDNQLQVSATPATDTGETKSSLESKP
jgi:osmotically-inducible protein OsmY